MHETLWLYLESWLGVSSGSGQHCRCPSTGPCQLQPLPLRPGLKALSGHRAFLTCALDRWRCWRMNSPGSNMQSMTNGNWRKAPSPLSLGQGDSEISVCSTLTARVPWSVGSRVPTVWICSFLAAPCSVTKGSQVARHEHYGVCHVSEGGRSGQCLRDLHGSSQNSSFFKKTILKNTALHKFVYISTNPNEHFVVGWHWF